MKRRDDVRPGESTLSSREKKYLKVEEKYVWKESRGLSGKGVLNRPSARRPKMPLGSTDKSVEERRSIRTSDDRNPRVARGKLSDGGKSAV